MAYQERSEALVRKYKRNVLFQLTMIAASPCQLGSSCQAFQTELLDTINDFSLRKLIRESTEGQFIDTMLLPKYVL